MARVIRFVRRANLRDKAALVRAGAFGIFAWAVDAVHIGRRAADIQDITFKIFACRDSFCLFQDGRFGAADDLPSFVQSDGAEVAFAKAAPVRGERKPDGIHRPYFALFKVMRMNFARVI